MLLAASPWHANIFDPNARDLGDMDGAVVGVGKLPPPPKLWVEAVGPDVIVLQWATQAEIANDEGDAEDNMDLATNAEPRVPVRHAVIASFELQIQTSSLKFDGNEIHEGFHPEWLPLGRVDGAARLYALRGVEEECLYKLAVRMVGELGAFGGWSNEVEVRAGEIGSGGEGDLESQRRMLGRLGAGGSTHFSGRDIGGGGGHGVIGRGLGDGSGKRGRGHAGGRGTGGGDGDSGSMMTRRVPKGWLEVDVKDIAQAASSATGSPMSNFIDELEDALAPHVHVLKMLFAMWSVHGVTRVADDGEPQMSKMQFGKFCKETGVAASATKDGDAVEVPGLRKLPQNQVDLLFQRANLNQEYSGDDGGDGGISTMVMHEFIHALLRLAWQCFPSGGTLADRLNVLLELVVLPQSKAFGVHVEDSGFESEWIRSRRIFAITEYAAHPPHHHPTCSVAYLGS